ncbi:MAG TPA: hypothetical protein VKG89_04380 [Solirubrobacterales bacterium]|nr:hypothetical protein [Solirubrobacterales bacterium]
MIRKLLPGALIGALAIVAIAFASPAFAQSGGGCQLQGNANFSPGLNSTSQDFTYSFGGDLTGCQSTDTGAPTSGAVEAGKVLTDPSGEQFQEPAATGTGSCGSSTTNGTGIVTWSDGTQTVVEYSTTGAAAAVNLSGTVVPSVTLQAINPQPGQPTSKTVTTTRYAGASALGALAFQPPDPTACAGAGVTTAGISGFIGLGSQ